ncbi:MAG TPA: hypothetical protein VGB94_02535 [Acidobacteriaceae bacterium]
MTTVKRSYKKLVAFLMTATFIALVGISYVILRSRLNTAETVLTLTDIAEEDIEVTDNTFDGISKDEWISVYASRTRVGNKSLLYKWHQHRTEIFRYDPGRWDNPLPSIVATGPNSILISIPEVSSVTIKNKDADGLHVAYDIGHIDYP